MNVPDVTMVGAVVALAGTVAWYGRKASCTGDKVVTAYFEAIPKQTAAVEQASVLMQAMSDYLRMHDKLSEAAHTQQCRALEEVVVSLRNLNGNTKRKG
jgi:hypothetical protein